ncbi:uncharacterized protein [Lepeophtheirus salmonis]|uniref:BTB domain-containing protein n=2 Tax=Lepeophtheirus salmonis TaxID=72036 RepID=A0A0K2UT90_LEPSM|nr:sex determination protein fruitless-like isoform X1 [Lepeophtheirus salmonis]
MASQHYSLRWNNHQSHVLSAFDTLLQNEALVDCTLVCEDTSVRAHKVVLSACSPYFQKIFTDNVCKHPIIVLKDIKGWEAQCIVDFMYKGETSVPESQLTSLIKAAESLKVRGLTSSDQYRRRIYSPICNSNSSITSSTRPEEIQPSNKVPHMSHPFSSTAVESRSTSPTIANSCPRRKQARPRRRSGDSIGNSSLDLSKTERKSPTNACEDHLPENLSMKRTDSSPAINLVKTETLLEPLSREHESTDDIKISYHSFSEKSPKYGQIQEQEARVEALQALNYMASGGGIPTHFALNTLPSTTTNGLLSHHSVRTSTNNAYNENSEKNGFEFQRISIDRSKMSEEEAFEHAIEMIQTRQMGFRKAADFFSVSKWKLYKTARKRGIYAEIKKQNQAQQSLSKVPSNVQHFADMGVYKQLKKKSHLTKEIIFPHLPSDSDTMKAYKSPNNNNNISTSNNNTDYTTNIIELQKKLFVTHHKHQQKSSETHVNEELLLEEEEEEEGVLVINHRDCQDEDDDLDFDREDST